MEVMEFIDEYWEVLMLSASFSFAITSFIYSIPVLALIGWILVFVVYLDQKRKKK